MSTPRTRWEGSQVDGEPSAYALTFERLIAAGDDVDGEARLADALAPRGARVLDVGSGLGRVAGALAARGHDVTAVEKDPDLVARSQRLFPHVPVVVSDLLDLTAERLAAEGRPAAYDVAVVVGNVMVYLADGTEVAALRRVRSLLVPGGRVLVGFHPQEGPAGSRDYAADAFVAHAREAGLVLDHLAGSYELAPPAEDYVVALLTAP